MMRKKSGQGFTLIELMIVIAIVAILITVAMPSYQDQVQRSRRADGKIALVKAAAMQEQYYFTSDTYSNDVNNIGGSGGTLNSIEGNYAITSNVTAGTTGCSVDGICFVLTATALGVQTGDTGCTTLTLTNTGVSAPDACFSR